MANESATTSSQATPSEWVSNAAVSVLYLSCDVAIGSVYGPHSLEHPRPRPLLPPTGKWKWKVDEDGDGWGGWSTPTANGQEAGPRDIWQLIAS